MLQKLPPFTHWLPGPDPLLQVLDRRIPLPIRQLLIEPPLNRLFAEAIADDAFQPFEGRTVRLQMTGSDWGITLGFWHGCLRLLEDTEADVTIRGSWHTFTTLARRNQDPDALFFRRELVIEGDTELGLGVKNLLDGLE